MSNVDLGHGRSLWLIECGGFSPVTRANRHVSRDPQKYLPGFDQQQFATKADAVRWLEENLVQPEAGVIVRYSVEGFVQVSL